MKAIRRPASAAPGMVCGSRYSCAGAHGCRWHRRILSQSDTVPPPSEIRTDWCIHSSKC